MLLTCLTPAALAREAERYRHMARYASANPPTGYTPDGWRRACERRAREYQSRADA